MYTATHTVSMFDTYTGEQVYVKVKVTVDTEKLALMYATKARRNKTGIDRLCHDTVTIAVGKPQLKPNFLSEVN